MERRIKNKVVMTAIHMIGWGLMFGLPLLFIQGNGGSVNWVAYGGYCVGVLAFMAVFYVNYFWLIGRVLFRRHAVRFIAYNIVLVVAVSLLMHFWHEFFRQFMADEGAKARAGGPPLPPLWVFMLRDVLLLGLTAALSVAIRVTGNWYRTETERQQAQQARTQAELQNLKSQLNPHFLFNTLNNIYSLIAVGPERAQEAVHELSGLLRHVLYEKNQDMVPLARELAFVRSYVELMGLRLPPSVKLTVDIRGGEDHLAVEEGEGAMVAPLLFISLIENAFKHGISADAPSFVDISLVAGGDGVVVCRVVNSYFPKADGDRSGSGIGLENLRRRLELLYPGRHWLVVGRKQTGEGDCFVAELSIKSCAL